MVGVEPRAVRRADAGRVEQILDRERSSRERPGRGPRLGLHARDERVAGIVAHDGITATASTSTSAPGTARPLTSTSVEAGRASPKTRLPHRVDPRPVIDVGEEDRDLDDVREPRTGRARMPPSSSKTNRACSTTSSPPTSSTVDVDREDPGDEDEAARSHRVRGVRELRPPEHADLLAPLFTETSATHSISTFAPSTARRGTSTSVIAGRVAPKTSCRTGLMSGRSSMSVRKIVTLTTSSKPQPRRGEHGAHVLEDLPRLRDDVVASDEPAVAVDRDDPGDVEEARRRARRP